MNLARHGTLTLLLLVLTLLLNACSDTGQGSTWNNPHPHENPEHDVLYSAFSERPKHLDPARSYSAEEAVFIDQIYEPPLQYHYLKRPYELIPLTLSKMPEVRYFDQQGNELSASANAPAFSEYLLTLQSGIQYQPHPAFAKDEQGHFVYTRESTDAAPDPDSLADFPQTGSKELTSDDYIYQIKRLADPARLSPIRGIVSQYIVGMKEATNTIQAARKTQTDKTWLDLRNFTISGVKKIDDYQFTIRLKGKYPQFKYWLAQKFFAPVPWQADRFYHLPALIKNNIILDWYPVGTGPFMMTKNDPNSEITLSRNPNFRDEYYPTEGEARDKQSGLLDDAGKKLPFLDKIVFRLEKESIPLWTKFLQGYYDRSGISSDSFDQAVNIGSDGVKLTDAMTERGIYLNKTVLPSTYYTAVNMLDPVLGGLSERARKLRQAIAIAYNTEDFINIFLNGRGEPAMGPIPPGIFGYRDGEQGINPTLYQWQEHNGRRTLQRKSIDDAKKLLAKAGYPDGRDINTGQPLVLNFDTITTDQSRLNWVVQQFKKINLQLNIRNTDYNRFKDKMENGNVQIFEWGWGADYPDPENFLFLLYGPNAQVDSKSGVNASNYKNPEYDKLFKKMQLMEDSPERMGIIQSMLAMYYRDMPWINAFHLHSYALSNAWLYNVKTHGISKNTLKYRRLDTALRQKKQQEWNQPVIWPLVVLLIIILIVIIPGYRSFKQRQTRTINPV